MCQGALDLAGLDQGGSQALARFDMIRLCRDGLAKTLEGGIGLAARFVDVAEIEMGAGVRRIDGDGPSIAGNCFFVLGPIAQRVGEIEMGLREIGPQGDGHAIARLGRFDVSPRALGAAQIAMNFRIVGIGPECPRQGFRRFVEIFSPQLGRAHEVQRVRFVRDQLQDQLAQSDDVLDPAGPETMDGLL